MFGPAMRSCEAILKIDGSLVQASQTAWNGVRHMIAFRCLAHVAGLDEPAARGFDVRVCPGTFADLA